MKYTAAIVGFAAAAVSAQGFTSIYNITATPDQVVNASSLPAPGQPGARGQFNYAINSRTNTICYDISLFGVSGTYQSLALTATHIHEAAKGRNGPPRIVFPNPVGDDTVRRSVGCLTGPFTTGLKMADNVTDTGAGFTVAQIEANPAGFFTDSHTNLFVPGVVRGQLDQSFRKIDGGAITTATLTATSVVTIRSCPATVVNCPYTTAPLVTPSIYIYTTVCPVSVLTTLPGYVPATVVVVVPATTPAVVPTTARQTTPAVVAATTTAARPAYTGAANAVQVGGAAIAAGLFAAML